MFEVPWVRKFGLKEGAVTCDKDGLFVGPVPLLQREPWFGGVTRWAPRHPTDIERDLGFCYGLPIDVRARAGGLAAVANALTRDDVATACIAAVHLAFPDPPRFAKGAWPDGALLKLAGELWRSGLLKDWDPDKHPRTGEKPNPGWFAEKPPEERRELTITRDPPRSRWPSKVINKLVREWVKKTAIRIAERAEFGPWGEVELGIEEFLDELKPLGLNEGEDLVTAQLRANFDAPKTLEELQAPPAENALGYEQHHIVEQNPSNIEKRDFEKFGRPAIDNPDNVVWVPRLKHEQISSDYSSKAEGDPLGRTGRNVIKDMDFAQQREAGFAALRKYGVLK